MSRDQSAAVGVEVGGGRIQVALIDRSGRVLQRNEVKALRGRPALATIEPCLRALDGLLEQAGRDGMYICGIGVSIPGKLDEASDRPAQIAVLPAFNNFPLRQLLATRYQLPVQLYSDVDAAILGEQRFGAGQGYRRLLFLTVNAVVGAACVIDGQLVQATQPYVGHTSHLVIQSTTASSKCSCGKRGCINALISSDAVLKMVQRALRRGDESSLMQRLQEREQFSMQLLAEEALRGDSVALQVYNEVGRKLSLAAERYLALFEPDILILSGSMLHNDNLLLTQVRSSLDRSSSARVCTLVEVVPASLGRDVALIGAVTALF